MQTTANSFLRNGGISVLNNWLSWQSSRQWFSMEDGSVGKKSHVIVIIPCTEFETQLYLKRIN